MRTVKKSGELEQKLSKLSSSDRVFARLLIESRLISNPWDLSDLVDIYGIVH